VRERYARESVYLVHNVIGSQAQAVGGLEQLLRLAKLITLVGHSGERIECEHLDFVVLVAAGFVEHHFELVCRPWCCRRWCCCWERTSRRGET